jgi:class 3 adenylate cyclase
VSDGVDGGSATLGPRTALEAVRKLVTVLFCDVVGSTTLAERLDPEALGGLMMTHFSRMEEIIVSHGGVVEKYVGDAVLAVFGYPSVHEDDAVRACRAAVDMRDALRQLNERFEATWGVRLETRTGVNTGEVVAAAPTRDQTLPLGDPANVAARLQTAAPPGEIYLGESTWRLVRQLVRAEPVRTLVLKGKTEPVAAWRLIEVASPGAAWPEPAGSVFAGRDAEMESLGSAFDACLLDRTCHLVTVIGEPGVGKSRLALEFVRGLGRRASVLRARCLSYGQGITFWPLAEIVKQAAGIGEREGPEAAVAALDRVLVDRSDRARIVGPLASAIGWRETAFPIEEVFWAARTALEHLAGAGPLAVVFDDIHWAEERFLELLDHVATNVLARPDLFERSDRAAGLAEHQVIRLQPLSEEATARMAEGVLGTSHLPTGVERSVAEASEGNPLFVEQLLELWQERGALVRSNGSWDLTADPGALEVPPTIRSLLDSRLDLLSTEHRSLLERAAVIGQVFRREGLLELADRPASVVDETLGDLMAKAFIDPHRESSAPEPSYRFHHVLLRDAAYGSTLKSRRAVLHERFGRWLRDNVGSRLTEYEELIGFHHERAYRYLIELGARDEHAEAVAREAFDLLASAGRRAHDREDSTAAVNLLSRAAALLPDRDPARLDLLPDLGEALEDAGELAEADSVLR